MMMTPVFVGTYLLLGEDDVKEKCDNGLKTWFALKLRRYSMK